MQNPKNQMLGTMELPLLKSVNGFCFFCMKII